MTLRSPFFDALRAEVARLGGLHNAHLHLDRAYTFDTGGAEAGEGRQGAGAAHAGLAQKHRMIPALHAGPQYAPDRLRARLGAVCDDLAAAGTRLADSVIDVTDDGLGMTALEIAQEVARGRDDGLRLRCAAYNPLGFRDDRPGRWTLFERAAERADFIGALPEVDGHDRNPGHIGFDESCMRVLELGRRLGKFVHVHLDQMNLPEESATERLLALMAREGVAPAAANAGAGRDGTDEDGAPRVWAVHVISPSTYDEARFARLTEGLRAAHVGVICCPSGALGMRQLRPRLTPTTNSIARVLELAAAGVTVRLGSDNICDMLSPATTADLFDEVYLLAAALRFYDVPILARLAAGRALSDDQRAALAEHLDRERAAIGAVLATPTHVA